MERPGGEYVEIAVARPVRGLFTYRVPPGWPGPLQLGQRVKVPFGRGSALGFVVGHVAGVAHELEGRVKPLLELLEPAPALPADVVELARFAAQHYRSPLG